MNRWWSNFLGDRLYKSSAVAEMGDCLATIDMGRKLGELGPHLTQCCLGRSLPPYQVASWSSSSPKGHSNLHTFRHVYCGQKAGWIKMPFGTEVGLGPGHIVLDMDPAPPPKDAQQNSPPRLFSPCLLWPTGRPCQQLTSFYFVLIIFICYSSDNITGNRKRSAAITWVGAGCATILVRHYEGPPIRKSAFPNVHPKPSPNLTLYLL